MVLGEHQSKIGDTQGETEAMLKIDLTKAGLNICLILPVFSM